MTTNKNQVMMPKSVLRLPLAAKMGIIISSIPLYSDYQREQKISQIEAIKSVGVAINS